MGCVCSGHEEAAAVDLPPPMIGKDIKVQVKRQGYMGFDADFNIYDCQAEKDEKGNEKPVKWMLLDVCGGLPNT